MQELRVVWRLRGRATRGVVGEPIGDVPGEAIGENDFGEAIGRGVDFFKEKPHKQLHGVVYFKKKNFPLPLLKQ